MNSMEKWGSIVKRYETRGKAIGSVKQLLSPCGLSDPGFGPLDGWHTNGPSCGAWSRRGSGPVSAPVSDLEAAFVLVITRHKWDVAAGGESGSGEMPFYMQEAGMTGAAVLRVLLKAPTSSW